MSNTPLQRTANMVHFPSQDASDPNALDVYLDTLRGDVDTNTTDVATNTADIATNTADIATNTTDIATNTSAISALTDSSQWVYLGTDTIGSSVANKDITISSYTSYDILKIVLKNVAVVTDNVRLQLSPSYDAGSTFVNSTNDNLWSFLELGTSAGGTSTRFSGPSSGFSGGVWLAESFGNAADESFSGEIILYNWTSSTYKTQGVQSCIFMNASGTWRYVWGTFVFYGNSADAEDVLRFNASSGNLDGGDFYIYGRNSS